MTIDCRNGQCMATTVNPTAIVRTNTPTITRVQCFQFNFPPNQRVQRLSPDSAALMHKDIKETSALVTLHRVDITTRVPQQLPKFVYYPPCETDSESLGDFDLGSDRA